MKRPPIASIACALALGFGAAAVPALAQADREEIIVTGRYGTVPSDVQSVSQTVSYADLDLSTDAGRQELRQRISLTARFLCNRLGETADVTGPGVSCRDGATRDAMQRIGTVEEHFAPRGTAWTKPTPWSAPYPADWVEKYPYHE